MASFLRLLQTPQTKRAVNAALPLQNVFALAGVERFD
jgi:hypothetical protein